MKHPQTLILYVSDVATSAAFYRDLFAVPIVEQSANFGMLALPGGTMLGLWARHDVSPAPGAESSGSELCVTVDDDQTVEAALAEARSRGLPVIQDLVRLDFGYTFVALSPDGQRIRVFSPADES